MPTEETNDVFDLLSNEEFIKWAKHPNNENQLFWEKWLENNPDKKGAFFQAKDLIQKFQFHTDTENGGAPSTGTSRHTRFDRILKNVLNEEHSPRFKNKPKNPRYFNAYPTLVRLAAAIIFITTFIYLLRRVPMSSPTQEAAAIQLVTKQNPSGRKSTIMLPDGTIVTLNSDSKIVYPAEFGSGDRKIDLVGEAFFKVAHDPLHPFVVTAQKRGNHSFGHVVRCTGL